VIGAVVVSMALSATDALACGCVDWPSDRRMKEADRVFLARAKKRSASDDLQHFDVLLWLKGEVPGKEYALHRGEGDCERTFNTGELALVFEAQGKMPVCNGNVDLDKLLPTLGDYLGPSEPVSKQAIAVALAGHVHGKTSMYYPPLAKRSLAVKGGNVTFTDTKGEALPVVTAVGRGGFTHVTLREPAGTTWTLVGRDHGNLSVLATTFKPAPVGAPK